MVSIKKAQLEMIGLMIIVLLIVMAALFFLWLSIKPESGQQTSLLSIKAYNLVNAVMNTEVNVNNCQALSLKEAIIKCELGECDNCEFDLRERGKLGLEVDKMVKSVLIENYSLMVSEYPQNVSVFNMYGCRYGVSSADFRFKQGDKAYKAVFKICT